MIRLRGDNFGRQAMGEVGAEVKLWRAVSDQGTAAAASDSELLIPVEFAEDLPIFRRAATIAKAVTSFDRQ